MLRACKRMCACLLHACVLAYMFVNAGVLCHARCVRACQRVRAFMHEEIERGIRSEEGAAHAETAVLLLDVHVCEGQETDECERTQKEEEQAREAKKRQAEEAETALFLPEVHVHVSHQRGRVSHLFSRAAHLSDIPGMERSFAARCALLESHQHLGLGMNFVLAAFFPCTETCGVCA